MEHPSKADDETLLAAQWKLLELRRERGIPVTFADLQRTLQLERRVLAAKHKAA